MRRREKRSMVDITQTRKGGARNKRKGPMAPIGTGGESPPGLASAPYSLRSAEAAQRYWDCLVENAAYDALANAAKFTMGSVSRVYRQLPPVLRKAPRSREMLRMQFEVVNHTRRYCTVPGGLWLQSWLLRHFPQTYGRLRDMKG